MPSHPWFTVWLEELSGQPTGQKGGSFTFGDYDMVKREFVRYENTFVQTNCASSCDWVPLSHELWYEFEIDGVGAGPFSGRSASAISDTGTSFLIGPVDDISKIAEAIGAKYDGDQGLVKACLFRLCNCLYITILSAMQLARQPHADQCENQRQDVPNLRQELRRAVRLYMLRCYGRRQYWQSGVDFGCALAFQNALLYSPPAGDTFIRQFCNMYDMKNNRIGLCMAK